jgi:hypothetical protein
MEESTHDGFAWTAAGPVEAPSDGYSSSSLDCVDFRRSNSQWTS